jgi:uncharacterized membrane protein YkvA (DUF1232 family)
MALFQRMKEIAPGLALEAEAGRLILCDPRTPWPARLLLGGAVAYALSPVDLIPDFIPVLGHLDDAVIVPFLFIFGLALVPADVVREHRRAARSAIGSAPGSGAERCPSS